MANLNNRNRQKQDAEVDNNLQGHENNHSAGRSGTMSETTGGRNMGRSGAANQGGDNNTGDVGGQGDVADQDYGNVDSLADDDEDDMEGNL